MDDPMRRGERYRKVAAEYDDLADGAASPFFRAYFLQIAQQYREPLPVNCRLRRRMARRSPANREQIPNVGIDHPQRSPWEQHVGAR
jgi:hypothetical protein